MKSAQSLASLQKVMNADVMPCDVLYITECSPWGKMGYEKVAAAFPSVFPIFWSPDMPKPNLSGWQGDWIISFKSDLILSRNILERARKGAINFHPSPPKYRGLGGYWWALHNDDKAFGVTCHHMNERIDHGEIIATESFPILSGETVESLTHRAAIHSLRLLSETMDAILVGQSLAPCGEKWGQHLYTSKELELAQKIHAISSRRHPMHHLINLRDARRALGTLETTHDSIHDLSEERTKVVTLKQMGQRK